MSCICSFLTKVHYPYPSVMIYGLPSIMLLTVYSCIQNEELIVIMGMHIKMIASFAQSIRRVLKDPKCVVEIGSSQKHIEQYISTFMAPKHTQTIEGRMKVRDSHLNHNRTQLLLTKIW